MEEMYSLEEAILYLIENGFDITACNTGRVILKGVDSTFEVAEYNELSGLPFNDTEEMLEYANEY